MNNESIPIVYCCPARLTKFGRLRNGDISRLFKEFGLKKGVDYMRELSPCPYFIVHLQNPFKLKPVIMNGFFDIENYLSENADKLRRNR